MRSGSGLGTSPGGKPRGVVGLTVLFAGGLVAAACSGGGGSTPGAPLASSVGAVDTSAPVRHDVDGVLRLGVWLPTTGPAAALGTPLKAAVRLAVAAINAAGGVNGHPVELTARDEGGSDSTASGALDDLLQTDQVDGIIGPASSRIALGALDVIAQAKAVTCSPVATAIDLDQRRDQGYFERTIGSDALEANALGRAMFNTGDSNFAVLYPDDDYGREYGDRVKSYFSRLRVDVRLVPYDPTATEFNGPAQSAIAGGTQVIGVIGSEPSGPAVLAALAANGAPPREVPTFVTDGLRRADLGSLIDPARPNASAGIHGVSPQSEPADQTFAQLFARAQPGTPLSYVAYAFDCVNLIALSADAAGSDDPEKIQARLVDVSSGGSPCTGFEACAKQLALGRNIDFNGASGDLDLLDNGDVGVANYELFTFDAKGDDMPTDQFTMPANPGGA